MSELRQYLTTDTATVLVSAAPVEALREVRRIEELARCLDGGPEVAVLRWPEHRSRLDRLRRQSLPRLLLLAPGTTPIVAEDLLEDWIRLPASMVDVRARLARLRLCRDAEGRPPRPLLDGNSRLLYRNRWVGLSALQEQLVAPLVTHFEQPVTTRELLEPWNRDPASIEALRSCIAELRRHLTHAGLEIVGVRKLGYLLQARPQGGDRAR